MDDICQQRCLQVSTFEGVRSIVCIPSTSMALVHYISGYDYLDARCVANPLDLKFSVRDYLLTSS